LTALELWHVHADFLIALTVDPVIQSLQRLTHDLHNSLTKISDRALPNAQSLDCTGAPPASV
ncbi:hypothetical protein, partial [Nostoc sp. 'Peltigera malacea cyanobiont' DB3992]|uniref:hypothetical protein n=1 Tax=Nostoc sp. 'Peltigera malacea cyanobiont' DB3992 TaxID=1206980 RepID=UPI0015D4ACC2